MFTPEFASYGVHFTPGTTFANRRIMWCRSSLSAKS